MLSMLGISAAQVARGAAVFDGGGVRCDAGRRGFGFGWGSFSRVVAKTTRARSRRARGRAPERGARARTITSSAATFAVLPAGSARRPGDATIRTTAPISTCTCARRSTRATAWRRTSASIRRASRSTIRRPAPATTPAIAWRGARRTASRRARDARWDAATRGACRRRPDSPSRATTRASRSTAARRAKSRPTAARPRTRADPA
jgi:hypothetical protein